MILGGTLAGTHQSGVGPVGAASAGNSMAGSRLLLQGQTLAQRGLWWQRCEAKGWHHAGADISRVDLLEHADIGPSPLLCSPLAGSVTAIRSRPDGTLYGRS